MLAKWALFCKLERFRSPKLYGQAIGPERGTFSIQHRAAAEAYDFLPDSSGTMPRVVNVAQGYVYIEGWANAPSQNGEGGFAYYPYPNSNNYYLPYVATVSPTGRQYSTSYKIPAPNTALFWVGAISMFNSDTVTVGPDKGKTCASVGGCLGLYFAYPQPGALYSDVVRVPGPENGWNAQSITCCIFQRMTTIASANGLLYNSSGGYQFGPVAWTSSWTEHYDPNVQPSPGATPNDDVADGSKGNGPEFLLNTAQQNLGGDAPGYTTFPNCQAYVKPQISSPSVETDTIYLPAAYPKC